MEIRPGAAADLPALTDLYNHYVEHSPVTFDDVPFTVEQRQTWFGHYRESGPHRLYVATQAQLVVGYATSSPFRPKPGYRTSVETTAYVHPESVSAGVGSALYTRLFDVLANEPVHRAYAGVALPNEASEALHARFGFEVVGTFGEVGTKFGRYIDVRWFEKRL